MILQGLKPRIFDRLKKSGRRWLQELPAVVWSLRTTPSRVTGFTPFFLVYGTEVVLPMDLEYGSPRVGGYDEGTNQRACEDSLDQLDEARTVALMHSARYQQALRRYQTWKIRRRDFDEGDLVLRPRQDNRVRHKLSPPWEGLYVVVKMLNPGTYKLADEDGEELANAWNIQQLRHFFRKDFQDLFVIYIPNTPVGCTNVNPFKLIKSKGNLAFPRKPSHPRGLQRGHAPPQNGPIFCKNLQARQVRLDLSLGRIQTGREQPSGKDARAGDSIRLREDTALLPCLWTSGPLVESNLPSSNSPRRRKRTMERCDKRNKKHHFNLQDVSNKQLFITRPHGSNANT
jgi:hypothetical protein